MPCAKIQPIRSQDVGSVASPSVRRGALRLHAGALALLDQALEARGDLANVAQEYGVREGLAAFAFALETRRMLRRIEGEIRCLRQQRVA